MQTYRYRAATLPLNERQMHLGILATDLLKFDALLQQHMLQFPEARD